MHHLDPKVFNTPGWFSLMGCLDFGGLVDTVEPAMLHTKEVEKFEAGVAVTFK